MKKDIHPQYVETQVTCTCGASFTTRSTATSGRISADVCSSCHPFYTGKQKILDTGGRVARFQERPAFAVPGAAQHAHPLVRGAARPPPHPSRQPPAPPDRTRRYDVTTSPFASALPLVAEHADIEAALAAPDVHGDPAALRRLNKRYAALAPTVAAYRAWERAADDLATARELAADDPGFAAEVPALAAAEAEAAGTLRLLLVPRDPDDDRDVILEVKAGEGGEESALFAGDLMRMYLRYAERRGWRTELLDATLSDLGGYKDARVAIAATGTPGPGEAPWARLKYEGGVHRVQRVPVTESQGRIHTSAAGVLVMPDIDDPAEVQLDPNDLKIDVFRSSGPGGQSVNTTDSAVRITHLPTGLVVSCQNEKSQLQNKESALRVLRARLHQIAVEEAEAAASEQRRSQVRTVDRSERIRTYNFPENRIADHRTGFKAYNLDHVLDGDLDPVVQSAVDADEAARLASAGVRRATVRP